MFNVIPEQAMPQGHDTERRDRGGEVPLHRSGLQLRHAAPRQGDQIGERHNEKRIIIITLIQH